MPEPTGENSSSRLPTEKIKKMKSQGLTNNQIIQTLQKDGYSTTEIFNTLNELGIQTSQAGSSPNKRRQTGQSNPPNPSSQNRGQAEQSQNQGRSENPPISDEELIESLIEEKWESISSDIQKVIKWKESTEEKINKLEQKFEDLEDRFDKLHESVVGKVGEYDQNIQEVGSEVKAMEKAFRKVLPKFVETVGELSKITSELKKSQKKKDK